MNVKQIVRECSGPPLGSYVLIACIGRVAYASSLMSLQQHGQTRPHWGGDLFVQLYGRSALIAPINGTVAQRSCDQQYWENIQHVL